MQVDMWPLVDLMEEEEWIWTRKTMILWIHPMFCSFFRSIFTDWLNIYSDYSEQGLFFVAP